MPLPPEIYRETPASITGGSSQELPPPEFTQQRAHETLHRSQEPREHYLHIVIITRDDERARRLERLPRLFGSGIRYDRRDGTIYYPSYQARVRVLKPEIYRVEYPKRLRLKHQPVSSTAYLEHIPRHRQSLWEKRWNRIWKEGGSVETAIRAMDHTLRGYLIPDSGGVDEERGKEVKQINKALGRISNISALLGRYRPGMPREEFNELFATAAEETAALFIELGMEDVKDPAKQRIVEQLLKASLGTDSLDRPNPMIMETRLRSALIQGMERLAKINVIRTKYFGMRIALANARRTDRYYLRMLRGDLSTKILSHKAFTSQNKKTTQLQQGILSTKLWQTAVTFHDQIYLRPYKTTSGEILYSLVPEARELLKAGNIAEAEEIIRNIQGEINNVLETYRRIYPEEPPSKIPITTPLAPGNG